MLLEFALKMTAQKDMNSKEFTLKEGGGHCAFA